MDNKLLKVKFKDIYESDRTYKIGEVAFFEPQKASNLVSVGLAEFVNETKTKEKSANE